MREMRMSDTIFYMKKAIVLINGSSGTGSMERNTYKLIRRLTVGGYECTVYPIVPEHGLSADEILKDTEGKYDLVVSCGGDGTLHHTVNALMAMENRPPLGFIPAGSTNDFATNLSLNPADFNQMADVLVEGDSMPYDIASFNGTYFDYIAAFGMFVHISYNTDQKLKNALGHAAYVLSAALAIPEAVNYSVRMRVMADTFAEEGEFIYGMVFSSLSIAGFRLQQFDRKDLSDGEFELLMIRKTPITEMQNLLNDLLNASMESPYYIYRRVRHVFIEAEQQVDWTLDGEFGGSFRTADITVHPHALMLKVAARH